jgi:hypothetical protein
MEAVWTDATPGPGYTLEQLACQAFPKRMENFADIFISIAYEAVNLAND